MENVGVVGLGYVGLPLAIEFADAGLRVVGVEDTRRVNSLLGWSPENTLEDILDRVISYIRQQRSNAAVARS